MTTHDQDDKDWSEWDDGTLGQSLEHAAVSDIDPLAIDSALNLQSISIRMPTDLLDDIKAIAAINGVGYQPLIKQVLKRFVLCEMKQILRDQADLVEGRKLLHGAEESQPEVRKRAG